MKQSIFLGIVALALPSAIFGYTSTPEPPTKTQNTSKPSPQDSTIGLIAAELVEPTPIPTPLPTIVPTPTPAPEPVRQAATPSVDEVVASITKWAAHYGVDSAWLLRVARCESGLRPGAINLNYSDGGNPSGVFQFVPPTFYANAKRAGIADPYIWNVDHQAQTAAYMFANNQSNQWSCK